MTSPSTRGQVREAPRGGRPDPLRRILPLLEVRPGKVVAAIGLGVLALACAIGLAAVAAWLIARASQMPPVLTLSVAVVAVRAFGIGRGVLRYCERLASHDVALRGMAALRANLYERLAASDRPVTVRRGELLARIGQDVDDVGDVVVRALIPAGVAAVTSIGSVILLGALLPAAGVALAFCLALAGIVTPWLAARAAARTEARGAAARGEVTALSLEILEESAPLRVAGRFGARLADLDAADARLSAVADDGARTSGLAAALGALAQGLAVLASLALGIPATLSGALSPEALSVIVLTPLAVFEATAGLPAAAVQFHRSREAARRLLALLPAELPLSGSAKAAASTPAAAAATARAGAATAAASAVTSASHASAEPAAAASAAAGSRVVTPEPAASGAAAGPLPGGVPDAQVTGVIPASDMFEGGGVDAGDRVLLVLDDVAAGWPDADGEPRVAVEGVSLTLRPGSVVALAGPSGVGKTTLLMTAAGLIRPVRGTVTAQSASGTVAARSASGTVTDRAAGGTAPVRSAIRHEIGNSDYRSHDGLPTTRAETTRTETTSAEAAHMGATRAGDGRTGALFVAEDGHVFDTTVLENLRVARGDVTPDEARAALDAVGLGEWLSVLPDGLDTVLGTDAAAVSGGERRRLLAARALLSPARVLLVDEPAEHLDADTADALVRTLAAHARRTGRAVLLATHRLTPLAAADEVLLLAGGPVAASSAGSTSGTADASGASGTDRSDNAHLDGGVATVVARGGHEHLLAINPDYAWAAAQETHA